jgi:hypothetical protein
MRTIYEKFFIFRDRHRHLRVINASSRENAIFILCDYFDNSFTHYMDSNDRVKAIIARSEFKEVEEREIPEHNWMLVERPSYSEIYYNRKDLCEKTEGVA